MKEVNAVIITIGDELLIGQTVDTNSAWIGQELNKIGIWVKRRIAIGDDEEEIIKALNEQTKDADVLILTGGLGPTADDITKPALCKFFGSQLVVNETARQNVVDIFSRLNRPLIERNLRQAEVPDNCLVLQNKNGTAPGMWFEKNMHGKNCIFISLPGVPHEMKGLMQDAVISKLMDIQGRPMVLHRTLVTAGIGESMLAEAIQSFEEQLPSSIKLAYLPAYGMVRLRLTCRTENHNEAEPVLERHFHQLGILVKEWLIALEDIGLPQAVIQLLREHHSSLSTAESCTGGYIAHLITSIPGSSEVFKGSAIAYANEMKVNILGVEEETLKNYGAVSEETIKEMIEGALEKFKTEYCIATSGIMGPGGGSGQKPVGTVWMAVGRKGRIKTHKAFFRFDRQRNIEITAQTALTLLYRFIKEDKA